MIFVILILIGKEKEMNNKPLTREDCDDLILIIFETKKYTPKKGMLIEKLYSIKQRL